MVTRHFCTYFDEGYLDRALILIDSMRSYVQSFSLEILCFDEGAFQFFKKNSFPEVRTHRLSDFEKRNPDVVATKEERTVSEYFFTCTAAWINDVFERNSSIDILTYVDADLRFYSSSEPIFDCLGKKSILISEHRFPSSKKEGYVFGRFNVGLLSFRNSEIGRHCLRKWRYQCIEWCFDRIEEGKFADQKYLDEWPRNYGSQLVIATPGINTGPWSLREKDLKLDNNGRLLVEGYPLIVYHFQGLRMFSSRHFYLGHYFDSAPIAILKHLYFPYVNCLNVISNRYAFKKVGVQSRYVRGSLCYRFATGYWLDRLCLSCLVWSFQHYILRLR